MADPPNPALAVREPQAAALLFRRPGSRRPAAQEIIKALALPAPGAAPGPPRALPLTRLQLLPRETSMLYGIGRVDASGRVVNREILEALRWRPGDGLEVVLNPSAIVVRACPDGPLRVPRRPCIVIPGPARSLHGIAPGDHVLLAAAPEYDVVIVHTMSALDDMLASYHATTATGLPRT
jgi:bifunctional DNA-binding transcriptional regulator/antitoxin component of YhaV-PrlF toxin-antitoxin module